MIDLKALRENPARFADGAAKKGVRVDIDQILRLDGERREAMTEAERLRAEQNRLAKESGPEIGRLMGLIKKAEGAEKAALEAQADALRQKPAALKGKIAELEARLAALDTPLQALLLQVPQPPDADVPVGAGSEQNVELRRWSPAGFDPARPFEAQRGFKPRTHLELIEKLGLVDFPRGVKMSGSRSYVLTGDGMRLHQAVLRYAMDFICDRHGFRATSVPVIVREECMVGTGFFPAGREQTYRVDEVGRGETHDLFLTGTGEVGLMGLHAGEILDEASLPLKMSTVSTCFRREAGAAGKDTAGLYRIHQFDKVEQVIICRADEGESRRWHTTMISIVEELLQSLGLPYRLLQCCTGDLGVKNADMVDIECWMPGRGEAGPDGRPAGAYGETHSASRLYDFQCRRLNMRYRPGGEKGKGETVFCHSLNNTVLASPRVLIPLLEMHQNADGTVNVPEVLRPHMGGKARIG
ncbi:MAG: serine--tRNA ligase [Phycisphaerales bacterium]|nr:serine--tRNA ligase [Phycisphaerales bacterium]